MQRSRNKFAATMPQTSIRLASELVDYADRLKPKWKTTPRFIEDLLETALLGLDGTNTLGKTQLASSLAEQVFTSTNKEEKEERVRAREDAAPKPAWDKTVPMGLTPHEDLIRDFWRTKKGSKGERAWNLLMGQLESIKVRHGSDVVREQLELAINGRWTSITLANYERFAPKQKLPSQSFDGSTMDWEALQNAPVL